MNIKSRDSAKLQLCTWVLAACDVGQQEVVFPGQLVKPSWRALNIRFVVSSMLQLPHKTAVHMQHACQWLLVGAGWDAARHSTGRYRTHMPLWGRAVSPLLGLRHDCLRGQDLG